MTIKIKYHDPELTHLEFTKGGKAKWIDLRAAERVELKQFEHKIISLGVSMELPDGYEAWIAPRSSTYKNWFILQTNAPGIIDHAYMGDQDVWGYSVVAMKDTVIEKGDRICQFRIMKEMDEVDLETVEFLHNDGRGGFGSTGRA